MKGQATNTQSEPKSEANFESKGYGYLSACGKNTQQEYKGWIEIIDDIPKGARIHFNAYKKPFGLSVQLGIPKINTTRNNENKFTK